MNVHEHLVVLIKSHWVRLLPFEPTWVQFPVIYGLDWSIYCTLGNHSKPLATINLAKSPTFLGNFSKGVKIFHFSSEIILGKLL